MGDSVTFGKWLRGQEQKTEASKSFGGQGVGAVETIGTAELAAGAAEYETV